jgi:hypothetical protein
MTCPTALFLAPPAVIECERMKRTERDGNPGMSKCEFDSVDDAIVAEIFLWLLAPPPSNVASEMCPDVIIGDPGAVADAARFARTCRRMARVWKSTPEVWATIDVGDIVGAALLAGRESAFAVPPLQLSWCRALSLPHVAALDAMLTPSMPNLTALKSVVDDLNHGSFVGYLESLPQLASLSTEIWDAGAVFGPRVRAFERVRCLRLEGSFGLGAAIHCFPGLTRLVTTMRLQPGDLEAVWKTCVALEDIQFGLRTPAELIQSHPEAARCAAVLTGMAIDIRECVGSAHAIEAVCKSFPNIANLRIRGSIERIGAIHAIATLAKLEWLDIMLAPHTEGQLDAMAAMGHSKGTPFRAVALNGAFWDLHRFFASPRCAALRSIELTNPDSAIRRGSGDGDGTPLAFAASLRSLCVDGTMPGWLEQTIPHCHHIDHLNVDVYTPSHEQLRAIAARCTPTPRTVVLHSFYPLDSSIVRAVAPAFRDAVDVTLVYMDDHVTVDDIVEFASNRPYLHRLTLGMAPDTARAVAAILPKHIVVCGL